MKRTPTLFALTLIGGAALANGEQQMKEEFQALMAMPVQERLEAMAESIEAMSPAEARAYKRSFRELRQQRHETERYATTSRLMNAPTAPARARAKIPGTSIQYDDGTGGTFITPVSADRAVGNRFDSALGGSATMACCFPVPSSGTISRVTFDMALTFTSSLFFSLYSDLTQSPVPKVSSVSVAGGTGLNTQTFMPPLTYQNGSFVGAVYQFNTMSTRVNVDTGTLSGQGFHAVTINDNTTMGGGNFGTGLMDIADRNAVVRVNGDVTTPVELMNFKVD